MQNIFFKSFILSLSLFLVACGAQQNETLDAKKERLKTLKNEETQIKLQIQQLEAEMVALDPTIVKQTKKTVVDIHEIARETFSHFVDVQGTVEANQNIVVSSQVMGSITKLYVKEGQYVKAGQILAQVDDAIMQSSLEEVKTALELANVVYEKQKNLWDQEIGTEIQYLTAKNQKEGLERKLKTLEEQLDKSKIRAPISGSIDESFIKVGENVSPGFPAFRIVNGRDLSLKANLSEAYIPYIKRGDKVKLFFAALDRELEAKVTTVGQSIHPVDRTFAVEVQLPNDSDFKPNMYGQISINDRNIEDAISIPLNIVQKSEKGDFVFVAEQEEGKWVSRRKFIQKGLSYDGQIEVKSGLEVGEKLIIFGGNNLSEGQEIEFATDIQVAKN